MAMCDLCAGNPVEWRWELDRPVAWLAGEPLLRTHVCDRCKGLIALDLREELMRLVRAAYPDEPWNEAAGARTTNLVWSLFDYTRASSPEPSEGP